MATLLFDLLTERESADRRNVFDVRLLAARLEGALAWLQDAGPALGLGAQLPVGFFGASTGACLCAGAHCGAAVELFGTNTVLGTHPQVRVPVIVLLAVIGRALVLVPLLAQTSN